MCVQLCVVRKVGPSIGCSLPEPLFRKHSLWWAQWVSGLRFTAYSISKDSRQELTGIQTGLHLKSLPALLERKPYQSLTWRFRGCWSSPLFPTASDEAGKVHTRANHFCLHVCCWNLDAWRRLIRAKSEGVLISWPAWCSAKYSCLLLNPLLNGMFYNLLDTHTPLSLRYFWLEKNSHVLAMKMPSGKPTVKTSFLES